MMPFQFVTFKLPNKGIASLVAGIVSARTCENTVRDSRIVTPEIVGKIYAIFFR